MEGRKEAKEREEGRNQKKDGTNERMKKEGR